MCVHYRKLQIYSDMLTISNIMVAEKWPASQAARARAVQQDVRAAQEAKGLQEKLVVRATSAPWVARASRAARERKE